MKFIIAGRVVKGLGYGRRLGFPTVNLNWQKCAKRPRRIREGIYVGAASVLPRVSKGKMRGERARNTQPAIADWPCAIVIGPKGKEGTPKIEAHLLSFSGSLYGREITLALKKYLRPFKHFRTEGALKNQIAEDLKRV